MKLILNLNGGDSFAVDLADSRDQATARDLLEQWRHGARGPINLRFPNATINIHFEDIANYEFRAVS